MPLVIVPRRAMKRHLSDDEDNHSPQLDPPKSRQKVTLLQIVHVNTIQRAALDFDHSHQCSVSLATVNIYCCLVCGKYLQGSSHGSPAFIHAVENGHHLFVALDDVTFKILPEGDTLSDETARRAVDDIAKSLNPPMQIDGKELKTLIANVPYIPGLVGLTGDASAYNVIIQLLAHIPKIRDYYRHPRAGKLETEFRFVIRQLWSPYLLRNHVSPHRLIQAVKKPTNNPITAYTILVNRLDKENKDDIWRETLRGEVDSADKPIPFWYLLIDVLAPQIGSDDLLEVQFDELFKTKYGEKGKYSIKKLPHELLIVLNRKHDSQTRVVVSLPSQIVIKDHKYCLVSVISQKAQSWVYSGETPSGDWSTFDGVKVSQCPRQVIYLEDNRLLLWRRVLSPED